MTHQDAYHNIKLLLEDLLAEYEKIETVVISFAGQQDASDVERTLERVRERCDRIRNAIRSLEEFGGTRQ